VTTRSETAAATRRALVDAAVTLLDDGGPEAVTLRQVGARAGVSRSAPYRHFSDKEALLTAVAAASWDEVSDELRALVDDRAAVPQQVLRDALTGLLTTGRGHPHRYRLMFATPVGDPTPAIRAAERAQDLFLEIVMRVVGPRQAGRYGGLLLATVHGLTGLEISGHLAWDKWQATSDDLLDRLIDLLPPPS